MMRRMTVAEQTVLIKALAKQRNGADMMLFDAICYGGQLEEYRDARNHITKVIESIPQDIRDAWDQAKRKDKADRLRAQADAVERGDA